VRGFYPLSDHPPGPRVLPSTPAENRLLSWPPMLPMCVISAARTGPILLDERGARFAPLATGGRGFSASLQQSVEFPLWKPDCELRETEQDGTFPPC